MKRSHILALLLLLLVVPVFVMAYIPLVRDVRRNVAIHQGEELLGRIRFFDREFGRPPHILSDAYVQQEDMLPEEVHYWMVGEHGFHLAVMYGQDSVVFDSEVGEWR